MERRNFLKGAAALVATPSLPIKALASIGSASGTAVAGASGLAAQKSAVDLAYIWCRMYAENKPDFKPELLTEHLGFSKDIAKAAFNRLLKNDVVRPTDIRGIYQSTKPFVDMSNVYNPTTHINKVVDAAKSKLPEIKAPSESTSKVFEEETEPRDDEQLHKTHATSEITDDQKPFDETTAIDVEMIEETDRELEV